jgi:hypothetical protein
MELISLKARTGIAALTLAGARARYACVVATALEGRLIRAAVKRRRTP